MITDITTREQDYPARYYASYDIKAPQPTPVTGWYDTWTISTLERVPPVSELIAITEAQWNDQTAFRLPTGRGVQDGKIIDYTPPPVPLPLKEQAQSVLASLQSQASWLTVRGKTFGPLTNHYVDILESIIDGTNVTCTTLPEKPADLTQ